MSVESLIIEGLYLMLVGMGFVISFLTILVLILNLMEKIVGHDVIETSADQSKQIGDSTLMAVISAAIHRHRQG